MVRPKEIRVAVGMSCTKLAKLAGRSRHTVRVYEADPEAVEPEVRGGLDHVYRKLSDLLGAARGEQPPT